MAADAAAVRAGGAFIEIFTKNEALQSGLASAQSSVAGLAARVSSAGQSIGGLGATISAPILSASKDAISYASKVSGMAAQFGTPVEEMSRFAYAAEQSGIGLEDLGDLFKKWGKNVSEAADGTGATADIMKRLGVEAKDIIKLPLPEQMAILADKVSKVSNVHDRARVAMDLFGKQGQQLLPLLRDGGDALKAYGKEADELGITLNQTQADEARAALKLYKQAASAAEAALRSLVVSILPSADRFRLFAAAVKAAIADLRAWAEQFGGMSKIAAVAAGSVIGVTSAMYGLSLAARVASATLTLTSTVIGVVRSVAMAAAWANGVLRAAYIAVATSAGIAATATTIWGAATATLSGIATIAASSIGLILSPVALLTAALVGAGIVAFPAFRAGFTAMAKGVGSEAKSAFGAIAGIWTEDWDSIKSSVMSGDLKGAFKIAVVDLKATWVEVMGFLRAAWAGVVAWLESSFSRLRKTVKDIHSQAVDGTGNILVDAAHADVGNWGWVPGVTLGQKAARNVMGTEGLDPAEIKAQLAAGSIDDQRKADADHLKTLADIEEQRKAGLAEAGKILDEERAKAQAEREAVKAAVKADAEARKQAARDAAAIDDVNRAREAAANAAKVTAANTAAGADAASAKGQFSAYRIQASLGVGDQIAKRSLIEAQKIAKNTDEIRRRLPDLRFN